MKSLRSLVLVVYGLVGCASPQQLEAPSDSDPGAVAGGSAASETPVPDDADRVLPFDPRVIRDTLDNGLVVYVRWNARPEDRAELRLAVNAGSVLEDEDQRGLAHFVEHMAFNGTTRFKKQELVDYLESVGMRMGPDLNAYTSFDETVYQLQVPTDSIDVLDQGIDILREWASEITFDSLEVEKERGVIIEEWRLGRGARARIRDQQFPILLSDSRYAERLPIGDIQTLELAPRDAMLRFYHDWYRPEHMAVVAVGDFDVERVAEIIRERFSTLVSPTDSVERPTFDVPDQHELLYAPAVDVEAPFGSVEIVYKHPRRPRGTYASYRESLVESLHHIMLNARLGELTQDTDPPFAFAYSGPGSFVREAEFYSLQAMIRESAPERALTVMLREAERVRRFGFEATELDRARADLVRAYESMFNEREKSESASYAAEYVSHFLAEYPSPGIEWEFNTIKLLADEITVSDVNAVAEKLIRDRGRVVLLDGPEKESFHIPAEERIRSIFAAVESEAIAPYSDRVLDAPLLSSTPEAGKIVEWTTDDSLDMTRITLSNGVRVVLKPTDFKNDQVLFSAYSPGGTSLVDDSDYVSATTAATIVARSGIGAFGPIELQKKLAGKIVGLSPTLGDITEGFSGSSSPEDLETLFQLLHLYFVQPRADSTAFESYKTRMGELLTSFKTSPETAFSDTIRVTMSNYHFRRRPFTEAMLDELDLDVTFRVFKERFADANDFTFYLVGAFEVDSVVSLIETYMGSLPVLESEESWGDVDIVPPDGVIDKMITKGIEPKSRLHFQFHGPFEWSRENRLRISALADVLRLKLREVLREDLGGTYRTAVSAGFTHYPNERYRLTVRFGCDPERVDELTGTLLSQIDSLKTFGIEQSYLDKVYESSRRRHEESLRKNNFWIQSLVSSDLNGWNPRLILTGAAPFLRELRPDDIKLTAARYLDTDRYARFVLVPVEGSAD